MQPEVRLEREGDMRWSWMRSLVGEDSARPTDNFTLDDGMWKPVAGLLQPGGDVTHLDYASSDGSTIRFGDGEFGLHPADGTIFSVVFRLAHGRTSNVAADTLTVIETPLPFVAAYQSAPRPPAGRTPSRRTSPDRARPRPSAR